MKTPLILFVSIILSVTSITTWSGLNDPDPIAGVEIAATVTLEGAKGGVTELTLNGAGLRKVDWARKIKPDFIKMQDRFKYKSYLMALYLENPEIGYDVDTRANNIIDNDKKMVVVFTIIGEKVTREIFVDKINEGFAKWEDHDSLKEQINQFNNAFPKEFKVGSNFFIQYIPGTGVQFYEVDKKEEKRNLLTTINTKQLEFKQAFTNIWLTKDNPIDMDLRTALITNGIKQMETAL